MISIRTKYLRQTNHKPDRIKAYSDSSRSISLTMSVNSLPEPVQDETIEEFRHRYVAEQLCKKMNWTGQLVCGGTKEGYVFVFLPSAK